MEGRQVHYLPTASLRQHPQNTRVHPKKQIERVAQSIRKFGFTSPILINEHREILAGHVRKKAAEIAGLQRVPTIALAGLSDAEQRAYLLADNKLAEKSGWDRAALAVELRELAPLLADAGLDLEMTGFEVAEIDSLLGELVDPENDPCDDPPPIANDAVSHRGDLWLLGNHRLLCGDAGEGADLRALMGHERATMVFADPPYNLRIRSTLGRGKTKHREFVAASGEMSSKQFTHFLANCFSTAANFSVDGSIHFVCTDWRHMREMLDAGEEVYNELKNLIVWSKTNVGQGAFYRSQHELIFVWKCGEASHRNNFELGQHGRTRSNVWVYPGVNTFRSGRMKDLAVHPTVKPVALIADAMRDCSRRGEVVLDPFMGSGTSILAAERVGRRAFGVDLDPLYIDAAVRRWQLFAKRDATLKGTGSTFDELAAARRPDKDRGGK
jgi:DNA modification methylase